MERTILVTYGAGRGATPLAAFDAALFDAGIANHNLLYLTSVIPDGFTPVVKKARLNYGRDAFGNKMYLVIAERRETRPGFQAWAGLGWVRTQRAPRRGLFVEHWGESQNEVTRMIHQSLASVVAYRKETYGAIHYKTMGIACTVEPVCAVVAAVYKTEGWK